MEGVSDAPEPNRPRPDDVQPPAARSGGRGSLVAALLLGGAGAAVTLLGDGRTWATGSAPAAGALLPVHVSGGDVTALPDALALVGLAALVAVFAVRGAGRAVVCALLALTGAGTVWTSATGAFDVGALNAAAARASGLTATTVRHIGHTSWPWITALGGLLLFAAGLLALRCSHSWPAMSSRYERDGSPRPRRTPRNPPDPDHPAELWKALDRGEDPTADPPGA